MKKSMFFRLTQEEFTHLEDYCQENERTSKAERKAEEETIGSEEDNL